MSQNIYDDPAFFAGYARLNRSVHGLAGAPEWAALRGMLPDLRAAAVADLGCGYGWFCRYAAEAGAARVLGLDLSEKMLERARQTTASPRVVYRQGNLEELELPCGEYDLVYSSLTLHYIVDLPGLFRTVFQALKPGGAFVFSMEHPVYTAGIEADWCLDGRGRRSWPVNHYQDEGPRRVDWIVKDVRKQHRTLGTILNALIRQGFSLQEVNEWGPSAAQVAADPGLAEERDRPMLVLLSARR